MSSTKPHLSVVPDGLNLDDPDDIRIALEHCRATCIDAAAQLAAAVKEHTDDPLLWQLADLMIVSLGRERRIRRLLQRELAG